MSKQFNQQQIVKSIKRISKLVEEEGVEKAQKIAKEENILPRAMKNQVVEVLPTAKKSFSLPNSQLQSISNTLPTAKRSYLQLTGTLKKDNEEYIKSDAYAKILAKEQKAKEEKALREERAKLEKEKAEKEEWLKNVGGQGKYLDPEKYDKTSQRVQEIVLELNKMDKEIDTRSNVKIDNKIKYGANLIGKSFVEGGERIGDFLIGNLGTGIGLAQKALGMPEDITNNTENTFKKFVNVNVADAGFNKQLKENADIAGINQNGLASRAIGGIATNAFDAVTALGTGGLTYIPSAGGGYMQSSIDEGATLGQATLKSDVIGTIVGKLETVLNKGFGIVGDSALSKIARKSKAVSNFVNDMSKTVLGKGALKVLNESLEVGSEIGEEYAEEILDDVTTKVIYDKSRKIGITADEAKEIALMTAITTVGLRGLTGQSIGNQDIDEAIEVAKQYIDASKQSKKVDTLPYIKDKNLATAKADNTEKNVQYEVKSGILPYNNPTNLADNLKEKASKIVDFANKKSKADISLEFARLEGNKKAYTADNKIVIDVSKAKLEDVIHEITHNTELSDGYLAMSDFVLTELDKSSQLQTIKEDIINRYAPVYEQEGREFTEQDMESEVVAKYTERFINDEAFVNKVTTSDRNFAQKIYDWVKEKVNYYKTVKTMTEEQKAEYDNLKQAEKLWLKALKDGNIAGKSKYSIQIDEFGNKNIKVDTDQNIFEGIDKKDYNKIAKMYINDYLRGTTTLSENDTAKISSQTANKYTNPGKKQSFFEEKMMLAPELKNALEIAKKADSSLPTKNNSKYPNWEYYKVVFEISGKKFEGMLNIGIDNKSDKHFYELNKIKEVDDISALNNPNRSSTSIKDSVTPSRQNVNTTNKYSMQKNEKYSIAGKRAMPNFSNLEDKYEQAEQMKKIGIDNETIRQNTNWFQDKNGDWKFEFSDKEMALRDDVNLQEGNTYKLSEILKHDTLFNAYPELADYDVEYMSIKPNGLFNKKNSKIILNSNKLKSQKAIEGTLIHEIQHAIQKIEGFENGTSSVIKLRYYKSLGEIEANDVKKRMYEEKYNNKNIRNFSPESSNKYPEHSNMSKYLRNRNMVDKLKDSIYTFYERRENNNEKSISKNSRHDYLSYSKNLHESNREVRGKTWNRINGAKYSLNDSQEDRLIKLNEDYELTDKLREQLYDEREKLNKQYGEIVNNNDNPLTLEAKQLKNKINEIQEELDVSNQEMQKLANAIDKEEKQHRDSLKAIKQAKDTFGTTNDFREAGYLLQDGDLLDFSGRNQGSNIYGKRTIDHRDIDEVGYDMPEFIYMGNIRLQPESNSFELMREPTDKQYNMLEKYINKSNGEIYIDIYKNERMSKYDSSQYKSTTTASKIINDLKTYFKTGAFPIQSELTQFRYSLSENDKKLYSYYKNGGEKGYDNKIVENAKKLVKSNSQGRRTKEQWLQVAENIGINTENMTKKQIEQLAYKSWFENTPNHKEVLNRQGNKFVKFTIDEWIDTVYNASDKIGKHAIISFDEYYRENNMLFNNKEDAKRVYEQYVKTRELKFAKESEVKKDTIKENAKEIISNNGDGKERKHYKSISTSDMVGKEGQEIARNLLAKDRYIPVSNKKQMDLANQRVKSSGISTTLESFRETIKSGKRLTADDLALGERLIQEYSRSQDIDNLNELIQDVAIVGTELGQSVQALSLIKKMSPEGQLLMLQKTIDRLNTTENLDIELTKDMSEKIINAKGEQELNDAMTEISENIAEQIPLKLSDKTRSWRYLAMLGNPRTHIRNILSNVAMKGTMSVKDKIAGAIEDVVKPSERTRTLKKSSKETIEFAKKDAQANVERIANGGKYDINTLITQNKKQFDNKILNKISDFNSNALEFEDKVFIKSAYEKALSNYMTANKLTPEYLNSGTKEANISLTKAREFAGYEAQVATFRQYSWLSSKINQIENKNSATKVVVGGLLPFKKTPINIAKAGVEYSPVGLMKTLTKNSIDLKKGNLTSNQYIDNISKGLTGTSIAMIGYVLAESGILNGSGGEDDRESDYMSGIGNQEYAIKVGDKTFTIDWLSPSAIPLLVGAEFSKAIKDGELNLNAMTTTVTKTLNPLVEMSMLQSFASTLQSYSQGDLESLADMGMNVAESYAGQYLPTVLGQLARVTDDTERNTYYTDKKGFEARLQRFFNKQIAKIPGASTTLEPRVDIWGEETKRDSNIALRAFNQLLNPSYVKDIQNSTADKEVQELYRKSKDSDVLPRAPGSSFNMNKEKINLTPKENTEYRKNYGKTIKNTITQVSKENSYGKLPIADKAKTINAIYTDALVKTKGIYADKNNIDFKYTDDVDSAIKGGLSLANAYIYRGNVTGLQSDTDRSGKAIAGSKSGNKAEYIMNVKTDNEQKDAMLSLITDSKVKPTVKALETIGEENYDTYFSLSNSKSRTKYVELNNTNIKSSELNKYIKNISDVEGVKDEDGETINGTLKKAKANYINQLDISSEEKLLLFSKSYEPSDSDKAKLKQYINSLNITPEEKVNLLLQLKGVKKNKNGRITW